MARAIEGVHDRELRAQLEKGSRRQVVAARSEARSEADAAVVAQLSESQADLGVGADSLRPPAISELVAGARVRLRGFPAAVVLRRMGGSSAEVEAGPLRMKVPLGEIIGIAEDEKPKAGASGRVGGRQESASGVARPGRVTVHAAPAEASGPSEEINVIGCNVEEAVRRVDKFLDNAALAGSSQVRIIHGHGTGALRRGLGEFLKAHPLVESVHAEAEDHGGNAVTVVELKE